MMNTKKRLLLALLLVGSLVVGQEAFAFQPFVVKRIRVVGLQRISEGRVLDELAVEVGENITDLKATESIHALFKTGFFQDVSLARDENTLVVRVKERPTITKLTLNGVKEKSKVEKLLKEAGIAEGRLYDQNLISAAQRELEHYYLSKGRYGVRIVPNVTEAGNNLVCVELDIYEGDVAKIKEVRIVGNCAFSERQILSQMMSAKTNWLSWFTSDNLYAREKLEADIEGIRSFYLDRGYINIQIESTQVSLTPDKRSIYITLQINEGEPFTFGQVTIAENLMGEKLDLDCILEPMRSGCTFSRKVLMDTKQALEEAMGDEGYALGEARPSYQIDEQNHAVNVTFSLLQGKRMYVRRILFCGNTSTADEVLRRELPQMEGTYVSSALVKTGKEKILRRGYGSNVEIETIPVPGCPDQVDLQYSIEEAKMGQIGAGIAYAGPEGFIFNFAISQENFLGTGKTINFTFDNSKSSQNFLFGYTDPYFTIDGIGMGFDAYYNRTNLSRTSSISDYATDTYGTDLRWVFPIAQYDAIRTSVGFDNTRIKYNQLFAAQEILSFAKKFGNDFSEGTIGIAWTHDSLDQRLFPKCGLTQTLAARLVVPGAKLQYYRFTYDMAWFKPLTDSCRWIFNLSSSLGYEHAYGGNTAVPFYRNFMAGGSRSVRGFEENSLGPRDSQGRAFGGNALLTGTASLIFPNPIKPDAETIRTALFLDAGQVYDTRSRKGTVVNGLNVVDGLVVPKNTGGIRFSAGLAITWHLPVFGAPLTLNLAKPLNAKPGDQKRFFVPSVGVQF